MTTDLATLETLQQAIAYFAEPGTAHAFMVAVRWPDGVICPHCDAPEVTFLVKRCIWRCNATACGQQFSAEAGTLFEESPNLGKWLPFLWMTANCRNEFSSHEVAGELGVTQGTARFMLQRVRLAMQTPTFWKSRSDPRRRAERSWQQLWHPRGTMKARTTNRTPFERFIDLTRRIVVVPNPESIEVDKARMARRRVGRHSPTGRE